MAQAAEDTEQKGQRNSISLRATSITGGSTGRHLLPSRKSIPQKYTAPLVDTLRSVTVVPQQVLKDTAATSLQDALRTVPGITFGAGEGGNPQGDRPFIRGFDAQGDTYLDGVRDTGGQSREIFDIESIEVSKGPNSSFGGRGLAGGSLNLVSKTPQAGDFTNGGFTYGSDQTRRYVLDVEPPVPRRQRRVPSQPDDPRAERGGPRCGELRPLGRRPIADLRPGHPDPRQSQLLPHGKQRPAGLGHSLRLRLFDRHRPRA